MTKHKFLNMAVSLMVLTTLLFGNSLPVNAMPANPTDSTKVPHYFGPYSNWANSPFTLPDVAVTITDPTGTGTGAAAMATVGANGAVTGITITNPGSGYSAADVTFSGSGTGAAATAVVTTSGVITAVNVTNGGSGFTAPVISITGGGATTDATGTAYGGVDAVVVTNPGSSYQMPTVDFDLPDDPNGTQASGHVVMDGTGAITAIVVDNAGSGYSTAPGVVIRDGTVFDPINNGGSGATASASLTVQSVILNTFGAGYASAPDVSIADSNGGTGTGATASATTDFGAVTAINLTSGGSGYVTAGGIKKFQDGLPVLCDPTAGWGKCADNNLGQHIPIAVADTTTFTKTNGFTADADYYVIALVQHREQMSSSLPNGTLLREYVQLETPANASFSKHVALQNDMMDGTAVPALMPDGSQAVAVDDPHFLGPVIVANKDKPVRIVFYNLLPKGVDGNLFLPVDSSMMGSGMGPMAMNPPADNGSVMDEVRNPVCTDNPQAVDAMGNSVCFSQNRATLHLHGGTTPWISDGTAHQWITPAGENTQWPQGVGVESVPDMITPAAQALGVPNCNAGNDGCMTFYYTNQQSARLLFYHDHAWGITRLNVYAGEAAGYVITDPTDQKLFGANGLFKELGVGTPLVIQDRTFVPSAQQMAQQDPTWDYARWGSEGNLWYHHVYMPAQNPGDPSGMSAFGRWMYGPWFWPPAKNATYGPIANPYYDPNCRLDVPSTWQYQTDPFCEPAQIPGTPNISVGMEQFNDTPLVNGTVYPTTTVDPKAYRFRILNAANDRFWNLQWYVADSTGTEVALKVSEVAAAQTDPNVYPTPDTTISPVGPSWIQIGSEGGFLPAPVVIPNQPITWITDPTRFDFGNVDKHSLLLAPAERADVIVDFSKYAGKTLILYNDAPAAFPARVASYDYYTGGPDLSPAGAPTTLPGYGPNTRTVMQVKVNAGTGTAFNLAALQAAFKHHADGSGVFESGQHPIIVGQAAYNSAYGTSFAASGYCSTPTSTIKCDGFARIDQQGGEPFTFDTLNGATTGKWSKLSITLAPKAIHDEMNAASFDDFGRMTANLGVEAVPAVPGAQNIVLYPFVNPATELIDGSGLPAADVKVTPITTADGTQIWKITHNGVDTHPIHFHLFDVQVLNRVTWDNIIIPPDANELGWKDTVRVSPLEDTLVALRPVIPAVPFEVPNSIRELNPMMPEGSQAMFNNVDVNGNPTNAIANQLVNFGWEYVYHCHILSHEEMDMMRPVSLALPPVKADGLSFDKTTRTLNWNDNSITETSFVVQRSADSGTTWTDIGTIVSPLDQPNIHQARSLVDATYDPYTDYQYRVVAKNTIGYGAEFPSMTVQSVSATITVLNPPKAPSNLTATLAFGPVANLTWTDNANSETGFIIQRATGAASITFTQIGTVGANVTSFQDATLPTLSTATTYRYQVIATNAIGNSQSSNIASVTVPAPPAAPTNLTATFQAATSQVGPQISLTWRDNANNETNFIVERSSDGGATFSVLSSTVPPRNNTGNVTYIDNTIQPGVTYTYRVAARNAIVKSAYSNTAAVAVPPLQGAPTVLTSSAVRQTNTSERVTITWTNVANETGYVIQWSTSSTFTTIAGSSSVGANITTFTTGNIARQTWYFRVGATSQVTSAPVWSAAVTVNAAP